MNKFLLAALFAVQLFQPAWGQREKKVQSNQVKTKNGIVEGTVEKNGVRCFKGIPFAAPPVNNLRWREPQPAPAWTGVKKCTAFGPSPMQPTPAAFSMWTEEFLIPKEPISEDCLYLNIWSGAKTAAEKRPVLVWIYGGGFSSGGSGVPIYDGTALAEKGVLFVSINYRVGVFGFLAHPDLTKESGKNASGNYGLMDQIAALKWVHQNVAAFGGDPENVTIAGQSAGSMSVNCLVASPLAKGLFKKAIAQSGASFVSGGFTGSTLQQAEENGQKLMQTFNLTSIDDLRKKPALELMQKAQGIRGPIVDGYVLPASIAEIFAANKDNPVILLTGWNEDEGLIFGPVKNASDFRKSAEEQYGSDATTFLKFYPATNDIEAAASQLKASRDMIFGVQNYTWANVQSNKGRKVYVYRFTRKLPATGEYIKYGAFHTGEVPYAYNNLKFVNRPWEKTDQHLANIMSSYWINFISGGDPNGKGFPKWPVYKTKGGKIMVLGEVPQSQTLPDEAALDFMYGKMKRK
ncbi:MAG TPA: carboxylesterase family protein [Flavitalea sp.]|nr:carboxylesterase family protein [Flavitalea sp.]